MSRGFHREFRGHRALIATMHGKERAIAPVLERGMGLIVSTPVGLDTDRFGTFTREIPRRGSQLDAARAKIDAAFAVVRDAEIALASKGSFGPDPIIGFIPLGREIVVLRDRISGLELVGVDSSHDTNFAHEIVKNADAARQFAERSGFPGHGLIVMGVRSGEPSHRHGLFKDTVNWDDLEHAVQATLERCGAAFLETDMRAHRNPRRMKAIGRASEDLVRLFLSRCADCGWPGFDVVRCEGGLPCSGCGLPTSSPLHNVCICKACGREERRPATEQFYADPGQCAFCNP